MKKHTVILDCGSGETCRNDYGIASNMIRAICAADTGKYRIVIKWQLFEDIPPLIPLEHDVFDAAYRYAAICGYETTASVFDTPSLNYLLTHDVPFIKIACRPHIWDMLPSWPDTQKYLISVADPRQQDLLWTTNESKAGNTDFMMCVAEYPASKTKYESMFGNNLSVGISDHTDNCELLTEYEPLIYEKHFKLPDAEGLDNGPWAMEPAQLKGVL